MQKTHEVFLEIYRTMLRARSLDRAMQLTFLHRNLRRQFLHSGMGSEAGGAGVAACLRPRDRLIPQYRGFAYLIGKGLPLPRLVSNLFGRREDREWGLVDDYCYYDSACGITDSSKLLGTNFSIAIGVAMAVKQKDESSIVVCVFGDGESSRNTFPGALNLSKLWSLPILWVCENNRLSLSTPVEKMSATPDIATRADGYSLPHATIPATDAIEIYEQTLPIVERVRSTSSPFVLEIIGSRRVAHSLLEMYQGEINEGMLQKIASAEDTILATAAHLKALGVPQEDLESLQREVSREVREEFKNVRSRKRPTEEAFWKIYDA